MSIHQALAVLASHVECAAERYPASKAKEDWKRHIVHRLQDAIDAINCPEISDYKLIAGKRCMQVAAMALRMIDDLDLEVVGPEYDCAPLLHTMID